MPEICVNLDAIEHNHRTVKAVAERCGFSLMPVLKMVACYPPVVHLVYSLGYDSVGAADVDELNLFDGHPHGRKILINLSPPDRAEDVVRSYNRSAISSMENLRALEYAAARLGMRHDALLMVDLGDCREGLPLDDLPAFLDQLRTENLQNISLCGLGTTLGCQRGVTPDTANMTALQQAAARTEDRLGQPLSVVSVGGSVFMDWLCANPNFFRLSPGCVLELRAGDPLLLGFDMYRNAAFPTGNYRRDIFTLWGSFVEVKETTLTKPDHTALNGRGEAPDLKETGRRVRALLDCGGMHTEVTGMTLTLPGTRTAGYSGNYTVLDVTDCPQRPVVGQKTCFIPGYWAVARAFRTSTVHKRCIRDPQSHRAEAPYV